MNKVFKIIWNNITQSFVVVSELAKSRGKLASETTVSSNNHTSRLFKLSALVICMMGASQAQAKFVAGGAVDGNVHKTSIAIGDVNATATNDDSVTMGNNTKNPYLNGIVIGKGAGALSTTNGNYNVVIGSGAQVGSGNRAVNQSIAIGSSGGSSAPGSEILSAWAKGDQSIAIGGNTRSDGNSSVAIGGDDLDQAGSKRYTGSDKFIDYNSNGIKVGEYTLNNKTLREIYNKMTGDTMNWKDYSDTVSGEASVAIGTQAIADADLSTALGTKSKASAFGSVAFGTGAKANKLNSVAIGTASVTDQVGRAYATRTILGETYTWAGGATVDAGDVVSFGSKGFERQLINVAPGDISSSSTDAINGSQLYGVLSSLEKIRYFSVKSNVTQNRNNDAATGTDAIAIGPNASSTADRGIAMGLNSLASQPNAISLGWNANTSAVNSIALGTNTNASAINAIALGTNAIGAGENTIAVGDASNAAGYSAMAFGLGANATGPYSITMGQNSRTLSEHAIAMGYNSNASGAFSIAQGSGSEATERHAIALGAAAKATQRDALALGGFANASGWASAAVGPNAKATTFKSVAIGADSEAGNNAFGTTSAQFRNDAGAITNVNFAATSSTIGGAVSVGKAGNERQIQHVGAGTLSATSTDAVNGSQLYTVLHNSGFNIQENGTGKSRINNNGVVNFKNGTLTTANVTDSENGSTVTFNVNTTNITTNAATGNATATNPNNIATAGDVVNAINSVRNNPITFTGNTGSTTKKLGDTLGIKGDGTDITSTAAGNDITFTLNKSNTVTAGDNKVVTGDAVNKAITAINLNTSGDNGTGAVNLATQTLKISGKNGLTTNASANGIEVKIDDATKAKIDSVDSKIGDNTIKLGGTDGETNAQNLSQANGIKFNIKGEDGLTSSASGTDVTVKLSQATKDKLAEIDTKIQNNTIKLSGNTGSTNTQDLNKVGGLEFKVKGENGLTANASGDTVTVQIDTATKTKIDNAANQSLDNINDAGKNVIKGLVDIEDGINTKASSREVNGVKTFKVNVTTTTIEAKDGKVAAPTNGNAPVTATSVANAINGIYWNVSANSNTAEQVNAGSAVKFTDGDNIAITQNGKEFTIGTKKDVSFDKITVGPVVINKDDGINAGNQKVTNVADGDIAKDSKDAINGGQLHDVKNQLTTNINAAKTEVKEGKNTKVTPSTGANNQTIYTIESVDTSASVSSSTGSLKVTPATPKDVGDASVTNYDIDLSDKTKADIQQGVDANTTVNTKGLTFTGDSKESGVKKLGDKVAITGDKNITTEANANGVQVKLNENLTVTSVKAGDTILNADGLKTGDVVINKNDGINAGNKAITGVANGTNATDAVNVSQLNDVKNTVSKGWNLTTNGSNSSNVAAGETVDLNNKDGNIVITKDADSDDVTFNLSKNISVDNVTVAGNVTAGDTVLNNEGVKVGQDVALTDKGLKAGNVTVNTTGINAGDNKITNVANGDVSATSKDAINGSQLHNAVNQLNTNISAAKTEVVAGKNTSVTEKQGDNGQTVYTVNATDTSASVSSDSGALKVVKGNPTDVGDASVTNYDIDLSDKTKSDIQQGVDANTTVNTKGLTFTGDSKESDVKKLGDKVAITGDKNITTEANTDGVQVKLNNNLNVTSVKAGDTTVNNAGVTVGGDVALTNTGLQAGDVVVHKDGINAGDKKITNVANGDVSATSKDAINGSQLHHAVNQLNTNISAAKTEVVAGKNTKVTPSIGANNQTIYTIESVDSSASVTSSTGSLKVTPATPKDVGDASVTNYDIDLSDKTKADIQQGVDANTTVNTKGLTFTGDSKESGVKKLGDKVAITGDKNITTEANANGVQVKLNENLTVTSVKAGDTTINNDGVKVGDKVELTNTGLKAGNVTVNTTGINAGNHQVKGVAAGTEGTDAVNLNQLNEVNATASKGWNLTVNNGTNKTNVAPGDTVDLNNTDKNIVITKTEQSDNVTFNLNKTISVENVNASGNVTAGNVSTGNMTATGDIKAGNTTVNNDGVKVGNVTLTDTPITVGGNVTNNVNQAINDTAKQAFKDLTFAGDVGDNVNRKLGTTVNIVGGEKDKTKLSDNNIGVVADGTDKLEVKLAKNLTGLESADIGGVTINDTGINMGDKKITGVKAGEATNDAVNKGQLDAVGLKIAGNNGTGSVTLSNQTLSVTGSNGLETSANGQGIDVKIDKDTRDLIDNAANQSLSNINDDGKNVIKGLVAMEDGKNTTAHTEDKNGVKTFRVDVNTTTISAGNDGKVVTPTTPDAPVTAGSVADAINNTYWNVVADNNTAEKVKAGSTVKYISGQNIKVEQDGMNFTISTTKNLEADNVNATTVNTTKINLGEGDLSTAITVVSGKDTPTLDGKSPNRLTVDGETVATMNDGLKFGANEGEAYKAKLNDQVNIKGADANTNWKEFDEGKNVMTNVDKDGNIRVAIKKDLNVDSVTANTFTAGNTVVNNDGLTIKDGPSVTSKGVDAGNKQVTNVADGRIAADSRDAINGSQLHAVKNDIKNLNNKVDKMGKRMNAGVAGAMAAANLMQPHKPGQSAATAAIGQHRNQAALAVGYSRLSDNGKYGIKVSLGANSQGDVSTGAGVAYFW